MLRRTVASFLVAACSPSSPPAASAQAPIDAAIVVDAASDAPAETSAPPPAIDESWTDDLPAPKGWTRATLADESDPGPFGYVCFFFGTGNPKRCPNALKLVASWQKRGASIRVIRRIDSSGTPIKITIMRPEAPRPEKFQDGAWFETPSDGSLFFWVVRGSLLIEMEVSGLKNGERLRSELTAFAKKILERESGPR